MGNNHQSNGPVPSNTRMEEEQVNERKKKVREGEQPSGLPMGGFLSLTLGLTPTEGHAYYHVQGGLRPSSVFCHT